MSLIAAVVDEFTRAGVLNSPLAQGALLLAESAEACEPGSGQAALMREFRLVREQALKSRAAKKASPTLLGGVTDELAKRRRA